MPGDIPDANGRVVGLRPIAPARSSPATAKDPKCKVKNASTDQRYSSNDGSALSEAIADASPGDRLQIKRAPARGPSRWTGACSWSGRTAASGNPTLDGNDACTVLTVNGGVTAAMEDLTITDGASTSVGGGIPQHR